MDDGTCAVVTCDRAPQRRGWCGMHYQRWWKHGDPEWTKVPASRCEAPGCDDAPRSTFTPLCEMHYMRLRRNGSFDKLDRRAEIVAYRTAHQRVQRDRGKASDYGCVDCGSGAAHWSYDYGDDAPLYCGRYGIPYSLDVWRYQPRCVPCHRVFDSAHAE